MARTPCVNALRRNHEPEPSTVTGGRPNDHTTVPDVSSDEVTLRDLLEAELRAMRGSIGEVAKTVGDLRNEVAESGKRGSEEHAAVRGDLQGLQRQLDTGVPSAEEFGRFKQHTYDRYDALERRLDTVEDDAGERRAVEKWKRWFFAAAGSTGTFVIAAVGVVLSHR